MQPPLSKSPAPMPGPRPTPSSGASVLQQVVVVLTLLFVFLVGIKGLGSGFKMLGKEHLDAFFSATQNPFAGLVVGILATTLVQSSSVTTSMVVALVAAPENPLPLTNAIPMIMGANIGTTVTNTLVSLAHMRNRDEFQRAFSVATCHDFFNFMTVAILLPLELATGVLSKIAVALAGPLMGSGGVAYKSPLKTALKTAFKPIQGLAELLFDSSSYQAIFIIILSGGIIVLALHLLVKTLRSSMKTRLHTYITRALDASVLIAMCLGAIVTVAVQSSSITTSLLVPLAGAGIVTIRQAFPITLGANVGTTVTALLASLAVSGVNAQAGLTVALVHLLFNVLGIAVIYPWSKIRNVPIRAAEGLARMAVRSKRWALFYVAGLFYGLPALLIYMHSLVK